MTLPGIRRLVVQIETIETKRLNQVERDRAGGPAPRADGEAQVPIHVRQLHLTPP